MCVLCTQVRSYRYIHMCIVMHLFLINMGLLLLSYVYNVWLLYTYILLYIGFVITNGPQNTTVCMNAMAECYCGFTGASPNSVFPDWRIIFRRDDGSIVSNDIIDGLDTINGSINGLQWVPDLTSGDINATNSKLLVGPVNMTYNQSSYQCIFTIASLNGLKSLISSVGTMTVVGKTMNIRIAYSLQMT